MVRVRKGKRRILRIYLEDYGIEAELDVTDIVERIFEGEKRSKPVKEEIPVIDLRNLGKEGDYKKKKGKEGE